MSEFKLIFRGLCNTFEEFLEIFDLELIFRWGIHHFILLVGFPLIIDRVWIVYVISLHSLIEEMTIWFVVFKNLLLSNWFSSLILLFCKGYLLNVSLAITWVMFAKIREFWPRYTFSVPLLVNRASLHMTKYLSGVFGSPKFDSLALI